MESTVPDGQKHARPKHRVPHVKTALQSEKEVVYRRQRNGLQEPPHFRFPYIFNLLMLLGVFFAPWWTVGLALGVKLIVDLLLCLLL